MKLNYGPIFYLYSGPMQIVLRMAPIRVVLSQSFDFVMSLRGQTPRSKQR